MNSLQMKLLEMLKWIHCFLEKHNLNYYICAGTMLGAVRHNGFIPWDDDIDIAMPRYDYQKFCELLSQPVDHYVIETPYSKNNDYLYAFAKLYDLNTTMTEDLRNPIRRGIYIDVFPLDGLGNTKEEAMKNYRKIDFLNMLLMTRVCRYRKERAFYKNLSIFFGRLIPSFLLNDKQLCQKIDSLNKKIKYENSEYIGLNVSTYRQRDIHSKKIFGKPTLYKFQDIYVYGVENYEEYLTNLYGDWRKLPPENKRRSAHDFIDLDLNKSYLKK